MRSLGDEVEAVASALRAAGGQQDPPYALPQIVAAAFSDVVITGRDLPIGIEELVTVTDGGPLIIYQRSLSTAERRFVIAHALAHLIWDRDVCGAAPGLAFDAARELRADEFALELLAPSRVLIDHVAIWPDDGGDDHELYADQVDQIATLFHVPPQMIDRKIRELERLAVAA